MILSQNKVDFSILLFQGQEKEAQKFAEFLHGEHQKTPPWPPSIWFSA